MVANINAQHYTPRIFLYQAGFRRERLYSDASAVYESGRGSRLLGKTMISDYLKIAKARDGGTRILELDAKGVRRTLTVNDSNK